MGDPRVSPVELSIVIVNWNSAALLQQCVRSIVAETRQVRYEIVVIDNASFDGAQEQLALEFPAVLFVQSAENLGFAGANNAAALRARGDVLLFLNPDTLARNGAIDRMYAHFMSLPRAGVLGCRLLNTDGSLQTSCVQALPTVVNQLFDADLLRRLMPRARLWGMSALFRESGTPVEVEAVSGACMMIRRTVFETVGGFSRAFFMYGEDLDLCARVRAAGFRNAYAGDCEVVHYGGGSSRQVRSTFSVVMMCESVSRLLHTLHGPASSSGYRAALTMAACIRLSILIAIMPAWIVAADGASWRGAVAKWFAILGWGLGIKRPLRPRLEIASARARV